MRVAQKFIRSACAPQHVVVAGQVLRHFHMRSHIYQKLTRVLLRATSEQCVCVCVWAQSLSRLLNAVSFQVRLTKIPEMTARLTGAINQMHTRLSRVDESLEIYNFDVRTGKILIYIYASYVCVCVGCLCRAAEEPIKHARRK